MTKKLTLNKVRGMLYKTARIMGDIQAVKHNKIGKRILRRMAGKATGRLLSKLFK